MGISQLSFRISLLIQSVPRWITYGHQLWTIRRWQRAYAGQLEQVEQNWRRWESAKKSRKKEQVRRDLAALEQRINTRLASVNELADDIQTNAKTYWTVTRWLLKGHVDTQDGDPEVLLARMQAKRAATKQSTAKQ